MMENNKISTNIPNKEAVWNVYSEVNKKTIKEDTEMEKFNLHCPVCGYTDSIYKYEMKTMDYGFYCDKCSGGHAFIVPYPMLDVITELTNKNYIILSCDCFFSDLSAIYEQKLDIRISFFGRIYFPFIPPYIAVVHEAENIDGNDITTVFYHNYYCISPEHINKRMLATALKLLDWAIALPKLEERKFIHSHHAAGDWCSYESWLDRLNPRFVIRE